MLNLGKIILIGKIFSIWIIEEERFVNRNLQHPIWEISVNIKIKQKS
jgi:hypothetical protein